MSSRPDPDHDPLLDPFNQDSLDASRQISRAAPVFDVPLRFGPAPPAAHIPRTVADLDCERIEIGTQAFGSFLLEKALDLLDCPNHKVRAAVLHDLMEAQGLLGRDKAPPAREHSTLNQLFVTPGASDGLLETLKALSGGKTK